MNCATDDDRRYLNELIDHIQARLNTFETYFPNLANLEKYFKIERYIEDVEEEKRKYNGVKH